MCLRNASALTCLALHRVVRGAQEVHDRDARDLGRVLEGQEQAELRALVGRELRDVLALEQDLALGDRVAGPAHDHVGQRGLARAVRPHQRVDLALAHRQVDALQDLLALDRPRAGRGSPASPSRLSVVRLSPLVILHLDQDRRRLRSSRRRPPPACVAGSVSGLPGVQVERGAVLRALDRLRRRRRPRPRPGSSARASRWRPRRGTRSSPRFATATGSIVHHERRASPSGTSADRAHLRRALIRARPPASSAAIAASTSSPHLVDA